jgi:hypothetical protein
MTNSPFAACSETHLTNAVVKKSHTSYQMASRKLLVRQFLRTARVRGQTRGNETALGNKQRGALVKGGNKVGLAFAIDAGQPDHIGPYP